MDEIKGERGVMVVWSDYKIVIDGLLWMVSWWD